MYRELYVGTDDYDRALRLYRDVLGFSLAPSEKQQCRALERLWGLEQGAISQLARLETPGAPGGRLVLVQFTRDAPVVRAGATAVDLCPKNLDINVVDLPKRAEELRGAGYTLRSEPVAYEIGGLPVREVQLPVEDGVNLVLAEILGEALLTTDKGYGGVTSVVTTTADIGAETAFFEMLGFSRLERHVLEGPAIETMIGLPPNAGIIMQLLGEPAHRFGRAELVAYRGASGNTLYPRAQPPARGLFRAAVDVQCVADVRADCVAAGLSCSEPQLLRLGSEQRLAASVTSPAGWQVDIWQHPDVENGCTSRK